MSQTKLGRPPAGYGRQVACTLPIEKGQRVRALAKRNVWTISTVVRLAVEQYLADPKTPVSTRTWRVEHHHNCQVAFTLPAAMEKQIRAVAERNRWTLSGIVRFAIEEYLAREAEK